jgi:hypothetical protein
MRRCFVAVRVRDETERLPKCLNALAAQRDQDGRPLVFGRFGVTIFANNCDDKSVELVRSLGRGLPFPVRVVEASAYVAAAIEPLINIFARLRGLQLNEPWLVNEPWLELTLPVRQGFDPNE